MYPNVHICSHIQYTHNTYTHTQQEDVWSVLDIWKSSDFNFATPYFACYLQPVMWCMCVCLYVVCLALHLVGYPPFSEADLFADQSGVFEIATSGDESFMRQVRA